MSNTQNISYTYRLNDGATTVAVNAVIGQDSSITNSLNEEYQFEEKVEIEVKFYRSDYNLISSYADEQKFILYIDRTDETGTTTLAWKTLVFYKFDCEFNDNEGGEEVVVTPEVLNPENDIKANLNREFNLIEASPGEVNVTILSRCLVQVYLPGSAYMLNYQAGNWWETSVTPVGDRRDVSPFDFWLQPQGFAYYNVGFYVAQSGSLNPSIVGTYTTSSIDGPWTNGDYQIRKQATIPTSYVLSQISTATDLFIGEDSEDGNLFPRHTQAWLRFQNIAAPSLQCDAFLVNPWIRVLCNNSIFDTYVNSPVLPESDPENFFGNFGYSFFLTPVTLGAIGFIPDIIIEGGFSSSPTPHGRFDDYFLFSGGNYFVKPTRAYRILPFGQAEWRGLALWFGFDNITTIDVFNEGTREITLRRCHRLRDSIEALVQLINPNITFEADTDHSEFFFSQFNPVSGSFNKTIILSPKSNVKTGEFEPPATKARIRLADIFSMLWQVFRCVWWVDSSNRLRIEQIKYVLKGGDYTTDQIGTDITTLVHAKQRNAIETGQKIIKYKSKPKYKSITHRWMDDVSLAFEGYPIEDIITDGEERRDPTEESISLFTSDIDFVLTNPTLIADNGFVIMACWQIEGQPNNYRVPIEQITVNTNDVYDLQNLELSPFFFHKNYHPFDFMSASILINNETASTVIRTLIRVQELVIPRLSAPINKRELVKTSYGNGLIEEISEEIFTEVSNVKLNHGPA